MSHVLLLSLLRKPNKRILPAFNIKWWQRDVVLVTIQNLPVLMTTGYPISFPSVLKMWFFGMQAVSGRISRQKIMRS